MGKICLIATRYILFPICGLRLGEGRCETLRKGKDSILVVDDIQQKREVENFVHEGEALPFSGNPNLPIKNTFWSVFGIPAVMIFKMIREYFLSKQQIYSCNVKDGKEVTKLMLFNKSKIIHPFQIKKHLKAF